jgi:hypothetical protein
VDEKYGIEQFRDVVKAVVSLVNAIDSTTQDGFQLSDIFEFVKPLSLIPAAITGSSEIWNELADYSDEERKLVQEDIQQLDFSAESAEAIGEQAVRVATEFAVLLTVIRMSRSGATLEKIYEFVQTIAYKMGRMC